MIHRYNISVKGYLCVCYDSTINNSKYYRLNKQRFTIQFYNLIDLSWFIFKKKLT